ncbi:MAG: hypothetical protein KBG15_00325 [Kofleriaceae bacterium]|nr:hypothetical protein [Kofleriaceae bacterium]
MKRIIVGLLLLAACSPKKSQTPPSKATAPVSSVVVDAGSASPKPVVAPVVTPKSEGRAGGTDAFPAQPTLDAATQALIPVDGIMFASRTTRGSDDTLLLYQLTPTGLHEVFHQANSQVSAMGWLDRYTLVLYSEDAATGEATLQRIVDKKPDAAVVIPWASWKIPVSAGPGE